MSSNYYIEEVTVYRVFDRENDYMIDQFEDECDAERCIDELEETAAMKRDLRWPA